jgi:hypothetical protein
MRKPEHGERATSFIAEHSRASALVLLFVFAVNCAISVYNDTVTYDEPGHVEFGTWLLNGTLVHCKDQKMPITALNALPGVVAHALGLSFSDKNLLWLSRLPTTCFALLVGYFVFLWSSRLYGARGGLFSLLLFVFCPTTIAHARMATTDMYCAGFSLLAVYSFLRYIETPSLSRLLIAGALMGLSQLTKHTALLLFPVLLVTFCVRRWARPDSTAGPRQPRLLALHALTYVIIVWGVINAGYGLKFNFATVGQDAEWLQANTEFAPAPDQHYDSPLANVPIPLPRAYVEAFMLGQFFNKMGKGHGPIYLMGKLSERGWWYYFPIAFALKTPLPTLGILLLALFVSVRSKRLSLSSDESVLLLFAVVVFTFFSFFCSAQIGIRYLLPILPFLYVFAGQIAIFTPHVWTRGYAACVGLLSLWLPISVLSYFPHYISYFNEFCWNRLLLYQSLSDSNLQWDQDGEYLRRYLEGHPKPIAVNPATPSTGTVIVDTNRLTGVTGDLETYRWLREGYTPVSSAAYSWLVYEIPDAHPKQ